MPRQQKANHGRRTAGTMAPVRSEPHFLSLPLELRENVFSSLIDEESADSLRALLQVNRQLHKEAKPFLFRRPLLFKGQCELFTWLRGIDPENLRHVADITFQLQDIKPNDIVGALGKRLRQAERANSNGPLAHSAKDNPYHEACELEVKKIGEAFSRMSNLKKLSIVPCTEADPRPSHRMLIQFSKMLARCFPNLETLYNKEKSLPVNFVANKPRLRRLQVPSLSASSYAETAAMFANVSISQLALYGCVCAGMPLVPHTEMASEIVRAVPPLEELTLYESDVKLIARDVAHELLVKSPDAISKHLDSLRTLKILIEYTEEIPRAPPTLSQLHKFLQSSQIERLEMAEPLIFTLDHRLPSSIRTYVIRLDRPCSSEVDLAERVENLLDQFETFTERLKRPGASSNSNLKEIIILFEADEDEDEIEELEALEQAHDLFEGTDIELRWMLADFHASL